MSTVSGPVLAGNNRQLGIYRENGVRGDKVLLAPTVAVAQKQLAQSPRILSAQLFAPRYKAVGRSKLVVTPHCNPNGE